MARYFIEVTYKGTRYSGFQKQENANTIQGEIEKAFEIINRHPVSLTGSSRTDAGVHALQNYFHFDYDKKLINGFVYKMNSILPPDLAVKNIFLMHDNAHSRFDALSREYEYKIYQFKDPFLKETAHYYPYTYNFNLLNSAALLVLNATNFYSFCKTNTQVNNYNCKIIKSIWIQKGNLLVYNIEGNRFLRGMVRLLTATMLKVGREQMSLDEFSSLFNNESQKCGTSVPSMGLYLKKVNFRESYFDK